MLIPLAAGVNTAVINAAGAVVTIGSIVLAVAWWLHLAR